MWKTAFLIFVVAVYVHASPLATGVAIGGYFAFDTLDRLLATRARNRAINDAIGEVIYGWMRDDSDPEYENKGGLTRLKLSDRDEALVMRIADLLRAMPS